LDINLDFIEDSIQDDHSDYDNQSDDDISSETTGGIDVRFSIYFRKGGYKITEED
jgi:hypothetical protein